VRRLVLALTVLASLVLAVSSGAGAAGSGPRLKVKGAAHASGGKLHGAFTVENTGTAKSSALTATVKVVGAPLNLKVKIVGTVQHAAIHPLAPGAKQRVTVKGSLTKKANTGNWTIYACVERCVTIGHLSGGGSSPKKATAPNAPGSPPSSTPSSPAPAPTPPCVPSTGPIPHPVEEPFHHVGECGDEYFGFVPASYDPSTPMPLLVWMHGCGGEAEGDTWNVGSYTEEAGHGWLALSLGGRDGGCWNPLAESEGLVMAALADFEAHFNVDRHRVFLSGYSSGGDLAYRTGFRHSSTFAGLIIENSAPFEQTESTPAESLAAATTKFHIVHLAHLQDGTYPIANVRSEVAEVEAAGFPIELIEKPGTHADANTDKDLQELLVPYIEEKGWASP
jgi:predicted esterase